MRVRRITPTSTAFQTDDPDALVQLLARDHAFVFATPGRGERYRLYSEGMIVAVLPDGRLEPLGRQVDVLVLLLSDYATGGQAA